MSCMNAVDTNIFAYTFDTAAHAKQEAAKTLLGRLVLIPGETVMLWQVAVEFLACLRKAESRGRMTGDQVKNIFRDTLRLFTLKLPGPTIFDRGFALHDRYSLSHWDSLLVAACHEAGTRRLYSEDMQHGANYDGLEIVNPFL